MARKVESLPKLVQRQILDSELDLGKVRTTHPQGYFANEPDVPLTPGSDNIIWRRHSFNQIMGRCVNFNSTTSGLSRGNDYGWCDLSIGGQTGDPGVAGAKVNWLRTGGCSDGTFTTCSGFQWSKFFVPHYKTFRSTSLDLTIDSVVSERGKITQGAIPSGFTAMFTADIKKVLGGNVRLNVSTPNSLGVFVSGHVKYTSRNHANGISYLDFSLPPNEFTRLNLTYYSPDNNGFFELARDLGNQIDEWRTPPVPSGVQAHYSSFTRRELGSVAKFTYVMALITPPNDQSIKFVDIEYRSPEYYSQWRRVSLPVSQGAPNTQISGIFRVPPLTEIYCRARSVNEFNDVGLWHTTSGLVSAAGNVKPGVSPEPVPIRNFTVSPGLSQFQFELDPSQEEEWRDFILVSGFQNDHYVQTGISLSAGAGTRTITLAPSFPATPFLVASGMLISFAGGYSGDTTGELHLIESVNVGSQQATIREPFTRDISTATVWKAYQVPKISTDKKFSLFIPNDTSTYYFNVCGRNFNGGISYFAKDISSWQSSALTITASGALFEDGGQTLGRNLIRNGSFEFPKMAGNTWREIGWTDEDGSVQYWYTASGHLTTDLIFTGPSVINSNLAEHGRQMGLWWNLNSLGDAISRVGMHNGFFQDIYDCSFGQQYTVKGSVCSPSTISDYKISGLIEVYHEIWEYPITLVPIRDFQYGTVPGSAKFISSGFSKSMFPTRPDFVWRDSFKSTVLLPDAGTSSYVPLIRLCIYRDSDVKDMHNSSSGVTGTYTGVPLYLIDNIYFGRLSRESHQFDEDIDGRRFAWEGIRTNAEAYTNQGDHLDIDERFGFLNVRRQGNTTPPNKSAPSSLISFTTSGHMDFPRLTHWFPNVASLVGSPSHYASGQDNKMIRGTSSLLIVPSGKALMFDIDVRRTFFWNSENEIRLGGSGGSSICSIIPSGSHPYNGVYYDPGVHSVYTVKDVLYDVVGGSTGLRACEVPVSAHNGDLKINNIKLVCYTGLGIPTTGGGFEASPTNGAIVYWHSADVKIWEIAVPFVCSGINTTAGNNVGYAGKHGLINIDLATSEGYHSTSVYK